MDMTQYEKDRSEACERSRALVVERGGLIIVQDEERYAEAAPVLTLLRDLVKRGKQFFADTIEKAHAAHKAAVAARDAAVKEPSEAERMLNQAMKDFITERNRLQVLKEKAAEDARLEAAAKVEAAGDPGLADEMLKTPIETASPAPKTTAGVTARANWKARLIGPTGLYDLVCAVAKGGVPLDMIEPNMTRLNDAARDMRREGRIYPGVECYNDPVIATARR